jgi:hypothetical protein
VIPGSSAWVVIERTHGHDRDVPFVIRARHASAAAATEDLGKTTRTRHAVRLQPVFAAEDTQGSSGHEAIGGMRRRTGFAATAAVTVVDPVERKVHLEGHIPAKTAAAHHSGRCGRPRRTLRSR